MAPHSSTLAWKIPWMEEPGRLQSMGLLRVGHDWSDLAAAKEFRMKQWTPTGRAGGVVHIQCRQYWGSLPMKSFITRIKPNQSCSVWITISIIQYSKIMSVIKYFSSAKPNFVGLNFKVCCHLCHVLIFYVLFTRYKILVYICVCVYICIYIISYNHSFSSYL